MNKKQEKTSIISKIYYYNWHCICCTTWYISFYKSNESTMNEEFILLLMKIIMQPTRVSILRKRNDELE